MEEIIQALADWGAEQKDTMDRFLNDKDLYIQCAESFLNDENFAGLEKTMAEKDYASAFNYVHTLKGVAANLGLTPILNPLSSLTEELRHETYQNMDQYLKEIKDQKQKLQDIFDNA